MPSIVVPAGYEYALAAAVSTYWLNLWQTTRVSAARKKSGVGYPRVYAEKAESDASKEAMIFNCTQRAHQNTLEALPHTLFSILFIGLKHPLLAAGMGGVFTISRVLYTLSYSSGDPKKRYANGGVIAIIMSPVFLLASTYTAYEFISQGL